MSSQTPWSNPEYDVLGDIVRALDEAEVEGMGKPVLMVVAKQDYRAGDTVLVDGQYPMTIAEDARTGEVLTLDQSTGKLVRIR